MSDVAREKHTQIECWCGHGEAGEDRMRDGIETLDGSHAWYGACAPDCHHRTDGSGRCFVVVCLDCPDELRAGG